DRRSDPGRVAEACVAARGRRRPSSGHCHDSGHGVALSPGPAHAAMAQRTLWLTDAYFVGVTGYVQGLRAAVMDGVDVRLLVPGATDIPIIRAVSRAGYRPLLEAGIRVFEWNGPMLNAKTAVADGHWARVGSTNLNLASWIGNWELDVAVEDLEFGDEMEQMYLQDLDNATEIVLSEKNRVRPVTKPSSTKPALPARKGLRQPRSGSAS